ncbi:G-type lectin S-receptor-like serine/threonine-protein kinase SD2-5 [Camellia sinensis]|uniref:G-type lectin S-receptor-like serine/threonine-protein kinase SD2-5 n=1 Tax=Camellia sinensis TaxID=4442 RepID=UPI00103559B0|nr:G-type lectin S-receptor-like serine/threonine-protein kinase SD2-5 [Camellia sinensis]
MSCLKNYWYKAAFFAYHVGYDSKKGCLILSEVLLLINNDGAVDNITVFLKVHKSTDSTQKKSTRVKIILGSSLGAFFGIFFMVAFCFFLFTNKQESEEFDEFFVDQVLEMSTRFSYEELKAMTSNFDKKLGEKGFGSLFQGTLIDGTNIAVKCLNGFGQVKKSFLAEVETIDNIYHVNLFTCTYPMDPWMHGSSKGTKSRRKIIMDIAKGLTYLHEECWKKIFHLDIKPQNILLDEDFNAKISDFGLSKLIDKDQSQVVTMMRGTPSYLAPEWLSSIITEKVDVYSFGVVVLEMLCGRKNLDRSQPEKDMHLLDLFKMKAEYERFLDIVDKYNDDMQTHKAEVVVMMRVVVWCLQSDFSMRPSMLVVVKVLECGTKSNHNWWSPRESH